MSETRRTGFHRVYGAGPAHLLGMVLTLAVAAYACHRVYDADSEFWWRYAIWFLGAALLHDLLLAPAYIAVDRGLAQLQRRVPRTSPGTVNYVRVPAALSLLLLLVFSSTILGGGEDSFRFAAGKGLDAPYLLRWFLVSVVLFAASGLLLLVTRLRAARRTSTT